LRHELQRLSLPGGDVQHRSSAEPRFRPPPRVVKMNGSRTRTIGVSDVDVPGNDSADPWWDRREATAPGGPACHVPTTYLVSRRGSAPRPPWPLQAGGTRSRSEP